jgi:hypothetical protein
MIHCLISIVLSQLLAQKTLSAEVRKQAMMTVVVIELTQRVVSGRKIILDG